MRTITIYKWVWLCYAGFEGCSAGSPATRTSTRLMQPIFSFVRFVVVGLALLLPAAALAADDVALFKFVARDGVFEPATIEVPAGKRFRLEVSNDGKTAMEFESRELKQEKVIAPGKKAVLTINALKAGEYKFVDEFHEKTGQGKVVAK
jgi:plastocyanin